MMSKAGEVLDPWNSRDPTEHKCTVFLVSGESYSGLPAKGPLQQTVHLS